jgi:hypothetical protein
MTREIAVSADLVDSKLLVIMIGSYKLEPRGSIVKWIRISLDLELEAYL